ncbi:MAG: prephenate dehydrogenase/arogenate dehydrogenase family protein [Actinomyces sp.]|nr:MAG: prephenate dehydrogenase/arogenate dehydrogenase family protein [Actinomyces sp.]
MTPAPPGPGPDQGNAPPPRGDAPLDAPRLSAAGADGLAPGRALVVGVGLIGGSIGGALRRCGWEVIGVDLDPARTRRARERGVVDTVVATPADAGSVDLAVVATPVGHLVDTVRAVLDTPAAVVTDAGSVKAPVARAIADPRFVPGHPMAGSEQEGVDGADPDLFDGATWVLTPTETTDDDALARVQSVVSAVGAQAVVTPPERHDALVALVSHVPHLVAATLMQLADRRAAEHRVLLRLAAGGFRDMTRIAAGHPAIWPDICAENRDAIVAVLDELTGELDRVRGLVADSDREALLARLESARRARRNLPTTALRPDALTEVRVPVRDRKGELAAIASLAADLDVNIYDLEIAHSAEGPRGVVIVLVDTALAERLHGGLLALGYRPSLRPLT